MRAPVLLLLACAACGAPLRGTPEAPAPARPAGRGALAAAALDRMLEDGWQAAGLTPAPPVDDGAFLRRVMLDLVGRVPTLGEVRAFLAEPGPDRRARLVDRLLASRAFAEHWAEVYSDLLFGLDARAAKLDKKHDPGAWLAEAFAQNRPYDRIAHDLLTASGDIRENRAVAFVAARARGGGGAEAVTGAAARLFLGLQIQCAQCHDHPYDPRWKQEDFYGLVAFFARTRSRQPRLDGMEAAPTADEEMMAARAGGRARTFVVTDVRRGEAKMRRPRSEAEEVVRPRFLGRELEPRPGETRRQALARAIVGSDLFAKTVVARTWAQLFGHGIVDPWDDLGAEEDPRHPPLLVRLAEDFRASGHDLRALLRKIVLSTAYARSAGARPDEAAVRAFAQAAIRPLSPEQLFASLVAATGAGGMGGRNLDRRLAQAFREYRFVFGDDEMAEANRFDGSVPQALLLLNGELTNAGVRAEPGGTAAHVLATQAEPAARLDELFLAAYARRPTAEERAALLPSLRGARGKAAWEDLFFALLTSTEAITNH